MKNPNRKYLQPQKEINIIAEVDVLVIGGGPAGISAAIGAARRGADTMLIEQLGSFGGMWTNGLVISLGGFNSWLKPYRRCVDGIAGEWLRRAAALNGAENNRSWVLNSNPEIMKLVADEMLLEAGVTCLLHTLATEPIMDGNIIRGIVVENVNGSSAIFANSVVDCTGNGDIFARAGARYLISKQLQPMTLPFFIGDVNPTGDIPLEDEITIPIGPEPGILNDPKLKNFASRRRDINIDANELKEAQKKGIVPNFGGPWFGGMNKNMIWVNTTRIYGSAINAMELTNAEIKARKDVHTIFKYYKDNMEGFENSFLAQTGATLGVRETRRLIGEFTLTGEHIRNQTRFMDSIALGTWPIDVHPSQGEAGLHEMYVPLPYQIPLRTLIPINIEQLVVGGRCISLDREALGSARVGATCAATGHAAGVVAALAAEKQDLVRNVDYMNIKRELEKQSAILD